MAIDYSLQKFAQPCIIGLYYQRELNVFNDKVHHMINDPMPQPAIDASWKEIYCLKWGSSIIGKYYLLFKLVTSVLSGFHDSIVESIFSIMGNIIDEKSGRISMETWSAI